MENVKGWIQSK